MVSTPELVHRLYVEFVPEMKLIFFRGMSLLTLIFAFVWPIERIMRHSTPLLTKIRKIEKVILFLRIWKPNRLLNDVTQKHRY